MAVPYLFSFAFKNSGRGSYFFQNLVLLYSNPEIVYQRAGRWYPNSKKLRIFSNTEPVEHSSYHRIKGCDTRLQIYGNSTEGATCVSP